MPTKKKTDYNSLVARFPLRPIRSAKQFTLATELCDELTDRMSKLNEGEKDYLNVLTNIILEWEEAQETEEDRQDESRYCSPKEMLKFLMEANGLTQSDLITEFGAASRVSEFLNGKRDLTKQQIRNLTERFKVSPELFLGTTSLTPNTIKGRKDRSVLSVHESRTESGYLPAAESARVVSITLKWTAEAQNRVKRVADAMGLDLQEYMKQVVFRQMLNDERDLGLPTPAH